MPETLANRIAYLQGLADGLEVGEKSSEGKILVEMIEILSEVQGQLRELHARVEEAEDYVEALDDDLEDIELYLFEDDDDLYETVVDCEDDDDEYAAYYDLDDDEDAHQFEGQVDPHLDTTYEFACPNCQEEIYLHEGKDEEGFKHYIIEPVETNQSHNR
ncbi:CD1247 N-terminal domain-containing protein [Brevibacillus sp. 179-C9.3 HS]|uniref:CD1247 N-terminal domain-containing protein n=1 Tax=unclassified Brevibacillus TaxID=2684853 RepID=UPI0039A2DBE0